MVTLKTSHQIYECTQFCYSTSYGGHIFSGIVKYFDNKPKYISISKNLPYMFIESGDALSSEKCNFPLFLEDIKQYESVCENNEQALKIKSIKMDILNKYIPK